MKERPILFSAPMVRAILGDRKTQTRRAVKRTSRDLGTDFARADETRKSVDSRCPYGQPGDRLWVKETYFDRGSAEDARQNGFLYRADGEFAEQCPGETLDKRWRPSIFMPRRASRITLEIVGVRLERLHDCSEGDALAEGYPGDAAAGRKNPLDWYRGLWNSINGSGAWERNPWVWVVEFRRVAGR